MSRFTAAGRACPPYPIASLVLLGLSLSLTGCGGCSSGISEAELRKRAVVRPPDEEQPAEARTATNSLDPKSQPLPGPPAPPAPSGPPVASGSPATDTGLALATSATSDVASNARPDDPLTETERRARSIENLEKIGRAVVAYAAKHGRMPTGGIPRDGELLLSWRVLILPELGYGDLYKRFKTNEPWDSRANKPLLDYIPPEYQSPERFDGRTNYLGVAGRGMVIASGSLESLRDGITLEAIRDGADNTLAVVEVDDRFAIEWTRPVDHLPQLDLPFDRLGALRGEGAFGVMASGRVVLLPREMPASRLAALFTIAGGEPIGAASFLKRPTIEPPPPTLATVADDPEVANQTPPGTDEAVSTVDRTQESASLGSVPYAPDLTKEPLPSEAELAKARELLKELYGEAYIQARTRQQRQKLLKQLLDDANKVAGNAADFHELARIASALAAALGDARSLLDACDLLERRFQVDALSTRLAALDDLSQGATNETSVEIALQEARRIQRQAFEADRYDVALAASSLLRKLANVQGDKSNLARLQQDGEAIEAAQALFVAAEKELAVLQQAPDDAAANEVVGRYLCLVKNRWEAGLPYLAQAAEIRLRGIASLDLDTGRALHETLELADQYWELAGQFKQPQQRGLHLRAAHHYAAVLPSLGEGLEKIRASRRIDKAISLYGQVSIHAVHKTGEAATPKRLPVQAAARRP